MADAAAGAPEPSPAVSCTHCSLPVPRGLVEPGAEHQFCCGGCRAVWETIEGCGLARYYEFDERLDAPRPATTTGSTYESYDDEVFA